MPLPNEAFNINGGCNCQNIRYRVNVPVFEERHATVYCSPGADVGNSKIPFIPIDHCNDCRRATGALLPMAIVTEAATVQLSFNSGPWRPALNLWSDFDSLMKESTLGHYVSSPARNRLFCTKCGTPWAYFISADAIPSEWGWPKMLDIWLGTVDRQDLEKDYMRPERMLWCQRGVPWIREFARNGAGGIPEHPLTKIDKFEGDEISEDMKSLNQVARNGL